MNDDSRTVVFTLDQKRFGIPLHVVERIVQVVEVTPVPQAPAVILGIINVQGLIVPVFDLRALLGLPAREIQITDQIVIARTPSQMVALLVDEVRGVEDAETTAASVPAPDFVAGVVTNHDALIFICDLQRFLSGDEQATLNAALTARGTDNG
ncbi:MAG: chemotaxis protein CheW [Armatimonadota bacterium]|nr:chemotaxis protein CheW [Armatimonadota bacterium]